MLAQRVRLQRKFVLETGTTAALDCYAECTVFEMFTGKQLSDAFGGVIGNV